MTGNIYHMCVNCLNAKINVKLQLQTRSLKLGNKNAALETKIILGSYTKSYSLYHKYASQIEVQGNLYDLKH